VEIYLFTYISGIYKLACLEPPSYTVLGFHCNKEAVTLRFLGPIIHYKLSKSGMVKLGL